MKIKEARCGTKIRLIKKTKQKRSDIAWRIYEVHRDHIKVMFQKKRRIMFHQELNAFEEVVKVRVDEVVN